MEKSRRFAELRPVCVDLKRDCPLESMETKQH